MSTELAVKKPNGSEPEALAIAATPLDLVRLGITQNLDIDKLAKLLELHREWEKNEARKAFVQAMNDFKKDPPQIIKNRPGPRLGGEARPPAYYYASLDQVCKEVIAGLSKHGIAHHWECSQPENGSIVVTCILTHGMGHSESTTLKAPPDSGPGRNNIQAVASTVTYLQRYTLLAATGLAAGHDTDGAIAGEESNGFRLSEERYVELRDGIENAGNLAELDRLYKAALGEAKDDQESKQDFGKAKNKAWRRLNAGR